MNSYHILNGDALKSQFPTSLSGELIVARECLVDGDVQGKTIAQIFATRALFISKFYGGTEGDYYKKAVPEFEKIWTLPKTVTINLWFEDDLFCQVNFWFVMHLLAESDNTNDLYLIRPTSSLKYGFGGMNEAALVKAFEQKTKITTTEFQEFSQLWKLYQSNDFEKMIAIGMQLKGKYPFLLPAINAHIERFPKGGELGKPSKIILQIKENLKTNEFGPIFKEFCERASIYGYGDLQVKRLLQF